MTPLAVLLPDLAVKETRSLRVQTPPGMRLDSALPDGQYGLVEFYCEESGCDCRRVFIQVIEAQAPDRVLASINYGWEEASFYRAKMPYDPEAPEEIRRGSLDPMNAQSEHSEALLELFRQHALDEGYRERLRRHYVLFKAELERQVGQPRNEAPPAERGAQAGTPPSVSGGTRIPQPHRERFNQVAAMLAEFGAKHLDPELTGFVVELWARICRRRSPECLRGKAEVWAAAVTHVIARMNFLFDRNQPVNLTFEVICGFFQTNKTTVGGKATEIERRLRLRPHTEPGLCRRELIETFTNVRLSNGIVLSWKMAKQMGYLPPDANVEDLR